jgi:radical SAM protein with 4Fe4S-binding SPASM domain
MRGLFPILLTNGLLLQKRSNELIRSGLGMVIVSVDSIQPEIYCAMRGVNLEPVLKGINALLAFPEEDRPIVTVTTVITSQNIDHLEEVVTYFSERGVGVKLTPYHHHGRWEDDYLSPKDSNAYHIAIDKLKQMKEAGYGIINSLTYLDNFANYNFNRNVPKGFRCYGGYTTLYIDPMLNVRSCWSAGLPVAGNLYKSRLNELINGSKMRQIRQNIRKLKCEKCWLLCTGEISLRFQ